MKYKVKVPILDNKMLYLVDLYDPDKPMLFHSKEEALKSACLFHYYEIVEHNDADLHLQEGGEKESKCLEIIKEKTNYTNLNLNKSNLESSETKRDDMPSKRVRSRRAMAKK